MTPIRVFMKKVEVAIAALEERGDKQSPMYERLTAQLNKTRLEVACLEDSLSGEEPEVDGEVEDESEEEETSTDELESIPA